MTLNEPHCLSRWKDIYWEVEKRTILNRAKRLSNVLSGQNISIDNITKGEQSFAMAGYDAARFEEYLQEPPFNCSVILKGHTTLKAFINKWCIFKHTNIQAECDKIYKQLRRFVHAKIILNTAIRDVRLLSIQIDRINHSNISSSLKRKMTGALYEKGMQQILNRFPIPISLPPPIRSRGKRRQHALYRESDLYFAWRHYQRILQKSDLPNLKTYGEKIWSQTEKDKVVVAVFPVGQKIHLFNVSCQLSFSVFPATF